MTDERRRRAEQLFADALERPADQRRAFVEERAGDDSQLLDEVLSLLEASDSAGEFLEPPSSPSGGSPAIDLLMPKLASSSALKPDYAEGDTIGPYKIIEVLGEGGFGIVYHAVQEQPVRRRVALKVLKKGMDSKEVLERFEGERQALALMNHPNIAGVLDAGQTSQGTPYFAMELVRGVPITHYCRERNLSVRDRLRLLVPVCHAIQHAHQKGVIHRDIKPSNILVTDYEGEPTPKVIDFGIAKAIEGTLTGRSLYTRLGQVIGTLEYMSPEQLAQSAGDIDTRSDIYSLGVVLYEMLTGVLPFDERRFREAAWDEVRRIIREEQPPKPSTRLSALSAIRDKEHVTARHASDLRHTSRRVRGDVDWIVLRAMEKDRARRYDSATALADDIERFLHQQPVVAGPPSATYRMRKFVSRHRTGVAASLLLVLALVLGLAGTSWQWTRAEHQRALADERYELVRGMAADFLDELGDEVQHLEAATQTRRLLAETSTRVLERMETDFADDPSLRLDLVSGHLEVGRMLADGGGLNAEALASLREAEQRARAIVDGGPVEGAERTLAEVLLDSVEPLYISGDTDDALAHAEEGRTLALALSERPDADDETLALLARAHSVLGDMRMRTRDIDGTKGAYDESLRIRVSLAEGDPESTDYQESLAVAHERLGRWHALKHRLDGGEHLSDAIASLRRGLQIRRSLQQRAPEDRRLDRDLMMAHERFAGVLAIADRPDEADEQYEQARRIADALYESDPTNTRAFLDLQRRYENASDQLFDAGRYDEALTNARLFVARAERTLDDDPMSHRRRYALAIAHEKTGDCHERLESYADAEASYRSSLALYRELVQLDPSAPAYAARFATVAFKCAYVVNVQDRAPDSARLYEQAIETFDALSGDVRLSQYETQVLSIALRNLAYVRLEEGDPNESIRLLERAIETMPDNERRRPKVLWHLAKARYQAGQTGEAIRLAERAVTMMETEPDRHTVHPGELEEARADLERFRADG